MRQIDNLKKMILTSGDSAQALTNIDYYWELDGTLLENSGGPSLIQSGLLGYTSSGIPPAGNTVWWSGNTSNLVNYALPAKQLLEWETSFYCNISTSIAIQYLIMFPSPADLIILTAETMPGFYFSYRRANGSIYNTTVTTPIPKNVTTKVTIRSDVGNNWTKVLFDDVVYASGNYAVKMNTTEGKMVKFFNAAGSTNGFVNSFGGQIRFSGSLQQGYTYISGIEDGYKLYYKESGVLINALETVNYRTKVGILSGNTLDKNDFFLGFNNYIVGNLQIQSGLAGYTINIV